MMAELPPGGAALAEPPAPKRGQLVAHPPTRQARRLAQPRARASSSRNEEAGMYQQHSNTGEVVVLSRRLALLLTSTSAALGSLVRGADAQDEQLDSGGDSTDVDDAVLATEAREPWQVFKGRTGFTLNYPAGWILALDRSGDTGPGTLVVAGNFTTFDTVSVMRSRVADVEGLAELLGESGGAAASGSGSGGAAEEGGGVVAAVEPLSPIAVADVLLAEQRTRPSTYSFSLLRATARRPPDQSAAEAGADPPVYYDFEYLLESCRGDVLEVSGGVKRCIGVNDTDLDTTTRRHIVSVTAGSNFLYTVKASASLERWPMVGDDLVSVVSSFRLSPEAAAVM